MDDRHEAHDHLHGERRQAESFAEAEEMLRDSHAPRQSLRLSRRPNQIAHLSHHCQQPGDACLRTSAGRGQGGKTA
ncbi:hypothetical protein VFPBJ_08126 [Purpureocillium lilacinum]|uniref:Uncharacterized protein n=1 Tax=Purpureocillium lilacinum TaxID=33203 RepID=A0A179GIF9_PURLI|nr:hypothetical protein VFPBJ_08126 [Purpureocillium lilacinum]